MEVAKSELEEGFKTISEVMYQVGYTDPHTFRKVFRKYSGLNPTAYQQRYRIAQPVTSSGSQAS